MGTKQSKKAHSSTDSSGSASVVTQCVKMQVFGPAGGGKKTIIRSWLTGDPSNPNDFTIERDTSFDIYRMSRDEKAFLALIRLCGSRMDKRRWSNCFWHGADVAVFIYPLNCDPQELKKNAYFWLTSASRYGRFVHLVIVANKADLENPETRRVGEAIARFCEAPHYSISAEGEDGPQSIHDTMESISKDTFEINKQPNRQHAHFMDLDFPTEPVFISLLD